MKPEIAAAWNRLLLFTWQKEERDLLTDQLKFGLLSKHVDHRQNDEEDNLEEQ